MRKALPRKRRRGCGCEKVLDRRERCRSRTVGNGAAHCLIRRNRQRRLAIHPAFLAASINTLPGKNRWKRWQGTISAEKASLDGYFEISVGVPYKLTQPRCRLSSRPGDEVSTTTIGQEAAAGTILVTARVGSHSAEAVVLMKIKFGASYAKAFAGPVSNCASLHHRIREGCRKVGTCRPTRC